MAQTTSLVFNGGVIPSPSPAPSGSGKAKLLKIGEITVTEQEVQVTKKVICDPDSVTTVAPFMEVLTSARLAELISANNILVLDDGTMQYLMSDATVAVEDGTPVCTAVNFLGLSKESRAKVLYPCTRLIDELTLQQVIEVGEPVETGFDLVKAYPEDTEAGTLIDKLEIEDNSEDPDWQPLLEVVPTDQKVAINEDNLREAILGINNSIDGIIETINEMDVDSVPLAYLHSTLNTSAGDSVTTSTTVNVFAVNALEGDCFEFEQTTTIDDTPFGYVWIEPGTYLINASVTLQWVGNPRGTFIAKVGSVMGENFDFSQEQEIKRNTTKVVTIPNRMKLSVNITYDAGTPVMGFWIQSMQVVKLAGGMSQTNIMHDDTLVGQGSLSQPIGVDEAKVAQSTLAGNVAPAFDPTRTSENPYKAGESVVYTDGKVYTFKVDHYGAWAASDVQLTDEFWRNSFSRDAYQDGYIPNNSALIGDLTSSTATISLKVGCTPGQKFYVRGISTGNVARLWCTFDDYGRIKRRSEPNLDTRTSPFILTIEDGETGAAFNVVKGQTYFIAFSLPNSTEKISTKVSELGKRSIENSAETAVPHERVYKDKYISAAGVIASDLNFNVYEYEVNSGSVVHIKTATGGGYIAFYDIDGAVVGTPFRKADPVYQERVFYNVSVPSDAVLLRVTTAKSFNGVSQIPCVMSIDGFGLEKTLAVGRSLFVEKKILCIGDSITESGTWFSTLLEKTGAAQIWNRGASGTTLASYTNSTNSMCDRADLDADNDQSHHGGGFPSDENVDVVITWGGTNDFGNVSKNVQFGGALTRNKMTFVSGIFYLINKLKTKYPTKPIYICSILTAQKPGTGDWNRYSVSGGVYTEKTNWTGKTISDYNAAIQKIASMTGVHFIDMDHCGISPVNPTDYSNYFNADGLHPNDAGGVHIGKYIAESLVFDS